MDPFLYNKIKMLILKIVLFMITGTISIFICVDCINRVALNRKIRAYLKEKNIPVDVVLLCILAVGILILFLILYVIFFVF